MDRSDKHTATRPPLITPPVEPLEAAKVPEQRVQRVQRVEFIAPGDPTGPNTEVRTQASSR